MSLRTQSVSLEVFLSLSGRILFAGPACRYSSLLARLSREGGNARRRTGGPVFYYTLYIFSRPHHVVLATDQERTALRSTRRSVPAARCRRRRRPRRASKRWTARRSRRCTRISTRATSCASAASKHLASAADEPLFRELFARAWDEPAWPVASYRDLFLARHRATVAASAVDPAPMMASVESLAALKRGDAKGASTAHLADDARWGVVAAHAEELARAVNASETIDRTERTIDAANVVLGLHRWLIELTTMAHARRRCLADEAWWPASGNAALLAVSRALSACLTRCPRVSSSALLADETQTRRRPEMFSAVPEHPPLRELLGLCVAGPRARRRRSDAEVSPARRRSPPAAAAAADEAYGGVDHDHGAVDDATLAAAMGVRPWARASGRPRSRCLPE